MSDARHSWIREALFLSFGSSTCRERRVLTLKNPNIEAPRLPLANAAKICCCLGLSVSLSLSLALSFSLRLSVSVSVCPCLPLAVSVCRCLSLSGARGCHLCLPWLYAIAFARQDLLTQFQRSDRVLRGAQLDFT